MDIHARHAVTACYSGHHLASVLSPAIQASDLRLFRASHTHVTQRLVILDQAATHSR